MDTSVGMEGNDYRIGMGSCHAFERKKKFSCKVPGNRRDNNRLMQKYMYQYLLQ